MNYTRFVLKMTSGYALPCNNGIEYAYYKYHDGKLWYCNDDGEVESEYITIFNLWSMYSREFPRREWIKPEDTACTSRRYIK